MSDQTSIWKKEFKLRKRGEPTAVEPAAAPAVKTGSGSIWKKELKLGKSPKGEKKSAKKSDQATPQTTDAAAPTASKWKKELRMRRAVPARKPEPDPGLENAESALLGAVFRPEGAPMHDQWSASLAPAPMPFAGDDRFPHPTRSFSNGARSPKIQADLLSEADPVATSELDEPVRGHGGYELGSPATSSEEVASVDLVEGENGHDSTGSYSADSYVAHPYVADNDQSVDVARLAATPAPYGGGDAREPDESNATFGASPWKGDSIVPAESEVDESPQTPSWASSRRVSRAGRRAGRRVAGCPELGFWRRIFRADRLELIRVRRGCRAPRCRVGASELGVSCRIRRAGRRAYVRRVGAVGAYSRTPTSPATSIPT